jgi:hypothetical protein
MSTDPVSAAGPHSHDRREEHWFDDVADFLRPAHLRNAFTDRVGSVAAH